MADNENSNSDIPPFKEEISPEAQAARDQWHKEMEAENIDPIPDEKDIFKCFAGKTFPPFDEFNPYDPQDIALGYGKGSAKRLGFKPALVAEWISKNEPFKADIDSDILYFFNGKKWIAHAEPYLAKLISLILGQENRKSHEANIIQSLKPLIYAKIEFSNKIACQNCLLDVETLETTEFCKEEMAFYEVPITYNKDADKSKLSNWLEFLNQVANPDDIPLLQEWFGYCFLPDYRFHYALWIHGEGRNGKGVFDRTIKGLLGNDNFSTVGLERLDGKDRFVVKNFYGKLYNSSSEPISNKIFQTEIFQKLTGSDAVDGEFKNANKEKRFVNCAKITIIGNKFPRIKDPTKAFKDRMLFIKFPHHFDATNQIVNLEQIWLNDPEQVTVIFNWVLEGLQRLLSQGHPTLSKTQKDMEIEFSRITHPPTAFISEIGIVQKNLTSTRADVLLAFQDYCEDYGLPADTKNLTQSMMKLSPKVKDGWIYHPKKERAWIGFGLKDEKQQSIEQKEQMEQQNTLMNISATSQNNKENKNGVPSVPCVLQNNPLKVVTEDSGIRHIEVDTEAVEKIQETQHFKPLASSDVHVCNDPNCKGKGALEAVCYAVLSKDELAELKEKTGRDGVYLCKDCFGRARTALEYVGTKCVLDLAEPEQEDA